MKGELGEYVLISVTYEMFDPKNELKCKGIFSEENYYLALSFFFPNILIERRRRNS